MRVLRHGAQEQAGGGDAGHAYSLSCASSGNRYHSTASSLSRCSIIAPPILYFPVLRARILRSLTRSFCVSFCLCFVSLCPRIASRPCPFTPISQAALAGSTHARNSVTRCMSPAPSCQPHLPARRTRWTPGRGCKAGQPHPRLVAVLGSRYKARASILREWAGDRT